MLCSDANTEHSLAAFRGSCRAGRVLAKVHPTIEPKQSAVKELNRDLSCLRLIAFLSFSGSRPPWIALLVRPQTHSVRKHVQMPERLLRWRRFARQCAFQRRQLPLPEISQPQAVKLWSQVQRSVVYNSRTEVCFFTRRFE